MVLTLDLTFFFPANIYIKMFRIVPKAYLFCNWTEDGFFVFSLLWSKNKEYPLESSPPIKYEKEISVTCKPTPIFSVQYSGKYRPYKKCSCVSVQKDIQNLCGVVSKDWRFTVEKFTENFLAILHTVWS